MKTPRSPTCSAARSRTSPTGSRSCASSPAASTPPSSPTNAQPALRALADRAPVAVEIDAPDRDERLPEPIETTTYFPVAEALTNIAKYAHASRATVRVTSADGRVRVDVVDDGVGGANTSTGSGLRGLADRVAAVGGTLEVTSPPGRGTRVRATMPVA
jgi:signal transduction histidine kinase